MKVLDLFSGIGGFSLGLEKAGMKTIEFCEREPFCQRVLKKHWPDVPCHDDVTTLDGKQYHGVDVIAGGFPCQDISSAGKGAGLAGERSGLWFEYHRIIKEAQPRYAIIENVSILRSRGLDTVLRSLAEIGYDAEWHCIPASAVGAPHQRDRVWIVAYPQGQRHDCGKSTNEASQEREIEGSWKPEGMWITESSDKGGIPNEASLADTNNARLQGRFRKIMSERAAERITRQSGASVCDTTSAGLPDWAGGEVGQPEPITQFERPDGREVEYDFRGIPHGVSLRVDRLRSLGNSVVPQIAQIIGEAIIQYEREAA